MGTRAEENVIRVRQQIAAVHDELAARGVDHRWDRFDALVNELLFVHGLSVAEIQEHIYWCTDDATEAP